MYLVPHVTWVDNYSKMNPKSTARKNEVDYNQSLWTVIARHKFRGDHTDVPIGSWSSTERGASAAHAKQPL
jgi:hypothetical protein